jgi:DNA polymerase elongation subunit (family B)
MDPVNTKTTNTITNTITVSAISWDILDRAGEGGWDSILCWGVNTDNESILVRIENHPCSFYFEFGNQDILIDEAYAKGFHEGLQKALKDDSKYLLPFVDVHLSEKTKLYYSVKATMIKLEFKNQEAAKHARNILVKGIYISYGSDKIYGEVHEYGDIDNIRKLLTARNMTYCGWFDCRARLLTNESDKMSTHKKEYITMYQSMEPNPTDSVPKPLWLDFDLEVYSHNHNKFPRHWNSQDVIHTVSMIFRRDEDPIEKWKQYCIVAGDCIIDDKEINETVEIIKVKDEKALIAEYCNMIRKFDPDLISGYNILMFDNKYLDARITRKGEWPIIGRLKSKAGGVRNICWSSSAYKQKDMYIPYAPGRSYLDLYEHCTRSYGNWATYSLENAAIEIFPDDPTKRKQDLKPQKQFEIYKAMRDYYRHENKTESLKEKILENIITTGSNVSKDLISFVQSNDEIAKEIFREIFKEIYQDEVLSLKNGIFKELLGKILNGNELGDISKEHILKNMLSSDKEKILKEKITLDDKENILELLKEEIYKGIISEEIYKQKILKDMGMLVRYCVYDSRLVGLIANKIHLWIGIREMCGVVGVPPEKLLTSGQQPRVISLLYDACSKENIILDKRVNAPQFYYEGGAVQKPAVGFHKKALVVDFKSLYPNIIRKFNLCYTTLIRPCDYKNYKEDQYTKATPQISDIKDEAEELEDKIKKKDIVYYDADFRFLKSSERVGIIPKILTRLLDARAAVRKIRTEDPMLKIVYDQRQLALKVCANSVYGFTGVRKGPKKQCLEITATTTFFGRESINSTINWIRNNYNAFLVYGDTDSCMMTLLDGYVGKMHDYAWEIAKAASKQLSPLELEMEGIFDIFCVKQKHYAKFEYGGGAGGGTPGVLITGEDGNPKLIAKGLAPVRRDNCQWIKNILIKILIMIMTEKGYYACASHFIDQVVNLYNGKINIDDLVITKSLSSGYASDTATMKVFSDQMAKEGLNLSPGERHQFVVVDIPGEKKIGMKMMLLSVYDSAKHKIDYDYYFNNLLLKKIDVLLNAAYGQHSKKLNKISLKTKGRVVTGTHPAKFLAAVIKNNLSITEFKKSLYRVTKDIK